MRLFMNPRGLASRFNQTQGQIKAPLLESVMPKGSEKSTGTLTTSSVRPLQILQISRGDTYGGAAKVAWNLFRAYRDRGHLSRLAVSIKRSNDPDVEALPAQIPANPWARAWNGIGESLISLESRIRRGLGPLGRLFQQIGQPNHVLNRWQGIEDFDYPGSWRILDLRQDRPDVVHFHTLHGDYFDLRALPWLSSVVPVVLTLHDAWLLSGHCAHSLDCERWKTGCGRCPYLDVHPAVRRDETAYNWQRKREIYRNSSLHIAAPSKWLMEKVEQSILMEGAVELRLIPNGVDLSIFRPAEKDAVRRKLGLPLSAKILLFVATPARRNAYKDFPTIQGAGLRVGERLKAEHVLVLTLGEDAPSEQVGNVEFRFIPPQYDSNLVACYYQAADLYVHAAQAETFPNAVLEAMACGKPTVATAVGGIPEAIENGRTGYLVPYRDAEAMADRIEELLADATKRKGFEEKCIEAAQGFDLNRQADAYLRWYVELTEGS